MQIAWWKEKQNVSAPHAEYRLRLARFLGNLACAADGAPYVARGLISGNPSRLEALGDQLNSVRGRMEEGRKNGKTKGLLERLAEFITTAQTCPGVIGFTDGDWHSLEAIKPAELAAADRKAALTPPGGGPPMSSLCQ